MIISKQKEGFNMIGTGGIQIRKVGDAMQYSLLAIC